MVINSHLLTLAEIEKEKLIGINWIECFNGLLNWIATGSLKNDDTNTMGFNNLHKIWLKYFDNSYESLDIIKVNEISSWKHQKQPSRGVIRKRCTENMQQIYRGTLMQKCDFNEVAKQLYWNRTSAWVFSCKFAAYFQNTFFKEHLWAAASENMLGHTESISFGLFLKLKLNISGTPHLNELIFCNLHR